MATLNPEMLHSTGMTITDEFLYSEWMYRGMGNDLFGQKFTRTELARWLKAIGKKSQYQFDTSLSNIKPELEPVKAAVAPKMQRQETRIIELLQTKGYAPLELPTRKGRGDGAKSIVKELALRERELFTPSTFDSAWDRLRKDGRLAGGGLDPY